MNIFKIFLIFFVKTLVFFILIVYNEKVLTINKAKTWFISSVGRAHDF